MVEQKIGRNVAHDSLREQAEKFDSEVLRKLDENAGLFTVLHQVFRSAVDNGPVTFSWDGNLYQYTFSNSDEKFSDGFKDIEVADSQSNDYFMDAVKRFELKTALEEGGYYRDEMGQVHLRPLGKLTRGLRTIYSRYGKFGR